MKSRTRARSLALQVLYEGDQSTHDTCEIVNQRLEETPLEENLQQFVREIVFGVYPQRPSIDEQISQYAPEWPFDQIAIIDRNILRIAVWEMVFSDETPMKVVINEAVEMGKLYGSDASPRFINGVLGSLVNNLNQIKQKLNPVS
jgi:transcription antitermination protein NusB